MQVIKSPELEAFEASEGIYLRCPEGCGANSPREGLLERVRFHAKKLGYPFPNGETITERELLKMACDMTKNYRLLGDGKTWERIAEV